MSQQSTLPLHPYQQETLAAIRLAPVRGVFNPFVALPTGSGKNYLMPFVHLERGGRSLVLAQSERIVRQNARQFEQHGLNVGLLKSEIREYDADVVVSTVQTLVRPGHLARLVQAGPFRTVFVDEGHHAPAASYRMILGTLKAGTAADRLLIGLSATPFRGDGLALDGVFGEIVYQKSIVDLIPDYLCDMRQGKELALGINLDAVKVGTTAYGRDFEAGDLGRILKHAHADEYIVQGWLKYARDRRTIAFTPTLDFADTLTKRFVGAGVAAEMIEGDTPDVARDAMLARFEHGTTSVLVNCGVLLEGFDAPRTDCVLIARPTRSRTLFVQMVGRGTRRHPEKADLLVLALEGATRHSLVSLGSLYGLQGTESVREAAVRRHIEREHAALAEATRRELIARDIDLLRQSRIRWSADPDGALFALNMGSRHGAIDLVRNDEHESWTVYHVGCKEENYREAILARHVDLSEAMRIGEAEVQRRGAASFCDNSNTWLDRMESFRTTAALLGTGIGPRLGRTQREAGHLLTIHYAKMRQTWRQRSPRQRWAIAQAQRRRA